MQMTASEQHYFAGKQWKKPDTTDIAQFKMCYEANPPLNIEEVVDNISKKQKQKNMGVTSAVSRNFGNKDLNGLFAIYKPIGITSAGVLNRIKEILLQNTEASEESKNVSGGRRRKHKRSLLKIGHGGTLDRNASGVLVVGVGSGTKLLGSYLQGPKRYKAVGKLGEATDTHDAGGSITQQSPFGHVTESDLLQALHRFTGTIQQVPPLFSALKVKGERMSHLVAKGKKVDPKPARPVTVYNLTCTGFNPPEFSLDILSSGGFYVRKLIHDLGIELCTCAHMSALERVEHGPFHLSEQILHEEQWTLQNIKSALENFNIELEMRPKQDQLDKMKENSIYLI